MTISDLKKELDRVKGEMIKNGVSEEDFENTVVVVALSTGSGFNSLEIALSEVMVEDYCVLTGNITPDIKINL